MSSSVDGRLLGLPGASAPQLSTSACVATQVCNSGWRIYSSVSGLGYLPALVRHTTCKTGIGRNWVPAFPLLTSVRKHSILGDNGKLQTVFKCRLRFGRSAYVPYKILNSFEGKASAVKVFNALVKAGGELPDDSSSDEYADNEDDFVRAANTAKDIICDNSLSPSRSPTYC